MTECNVRHKIGSIGYNNASSEWVIALGENPGMFRRFLTSIWPRGREHREASLPSGQELGRDHSTEEDASTAQSYPEKIECPEVRELASDYLDESLPGGLLAKIRRHLAECKSCTAFVNTFRRTVDMMRELPVVKAPDSIRRGILDSISRR